MIEGTVGCYITRTGALIKDGGAALYASSVDSSPQQVDVLAIIFSNPQHVTITIRASWGHETLTGPQANRLIATE